MKSDQKDNPIEQIAAWLYSVARNQIIDRSRKHREEEMPYLSNNEDDGTFLKELSELMPDEDQSPEMDFIRSTVWEELENALLELPGEQRTVFELTELEGKIDNVNNYCIAVKEKGDDIVFLRKIVKGGADKSYGIQVAKLAGVPELVIGRAKEIVEELSDEDITAR